MFPVFDGNFLRTCSCYLRLKLQQIAVPRIRDSTELKYMYWTLYKAPFYLVFFFLPTYALIYIIKILSQAVTFVALFTPTCFDPYGSSSGSTAGPC